MCCLIAVSYTHLDVYKRQLAQMCIASWRKYCPDYEIVEWNEDNFDLDYNAYTCLLYTSGHKTRYIPTWDYFIPDETPT